MTTFETREIDGVQYVRAEDCAAYVQRLIDAAALAKSSPVTQGAAVQPEQAEPSEAMAELVKRIESECVDIMEMKNKTRADTSRFVVAKRILTMIRGE